MWADQSFESNYRFRGDQDLLNTIIQEQKFKVDELPQIYNWSRLKGDHPDAVVLHWHGPQGKSEIAHQIMRKNLSFFAG
jgi:hypothetical protein